MAIINRIRAALNPRVKLEELEGPDVFTPVKDLGEYIGAGYGIETPRARRRREQVMAEHEIQLGMIDGRLGAQLEDLLGMDAENDEHRAIVGQLADRSAIVGTMLRSRFPEMQEQGRQELSSLLQDIRESGLAVETRRVENAALEAAGLKDEWDAAQSLADDLRSESADFLQQRTAFGGVKAASTDPSGAGDQALLLNAFKVFNPGANVREGMLADATNSAGVPDAIVTAWNNFVRNGDNLSPETRRDLVERAESFMQQAQAEQLERNTRYMEQGKTRGIRQEMLDSIMLPTVSPGELAAPELRNYETEGEGAPVGSAREGIAATAEMIPAAVSRTREFVGDVMSAASPTMQRAAWFDRAESMPSDRLPPDVLERAQRGERDRIMADPATGQVFILREGQDAPELVETGILERRRIRRFLEQPRNVGTIERPTN